MSNLKENGENLIMFLGEILIGILLLVNPIGFTSTIIIIAGIILTVLGIANIINYVKTDAMEAMMEQSLFKGLILVVFGLFCSFRSEWFIVTFPVITMLYGIMVLITGLKKIQWTFDLLRIKKGKWFIAGISAILSIIFAVIIMSNPFSSTAFLWQFTGITLIIESIIDILAIALNKNNQ